MKTASTIYPLKHIVIKLKPRCWILLPIEMNFRLIFPLTFFSLETEHNKSLVTKSYLLSNIWLSFESKKTQNRWFTPLFFVHIFKITAAKLADKFCFSSYFRLYIFKFLIVAQTLASANYQGKWRVIFFARKGFFLALTPWKIGAIWKLLRANRPLAQSILTLALFIDVLFSLVGKDSSNTQQIMHNWKTQAIFSFAVAWA